MMNLKSIVSRKISTKNFIIGAVWTVLLFIMLCIWPGGMITNHVVSKSVADDNRKAGEITQDMPVIQQFTPQYADLQSIGFTLDKKQGQVTDGTVVFKVFDAAIQLLYEQRIPMSEIEDGSFTDVAVSLRLDTELPYYFRIETEGVSDAAPGFPYRSLSGCGPTENGTLYYGSTVLEDSAAVCRYEYGAPLGIFQIMTYASFLILLGGMAAFGISNLSKTKKGSFLNRAQTVPFWAGIAGSLSGIMLSAAAGYFLIVMDIFKVGRGDKAVYLAGLLFADIVWVYFMRYGLPRITGAIRYGVQKGNRASVLRTFLFSAICILGMYYFNSGSNHGHALATRYMLLCFAGILAAFYSLRTLLTKWTGLYAAVCMLGTAVYVLARRAEEGKVFIILLDCLVAIAWGILIIRLLRNVKEGKVRKLSLRYAIPVFLFFLLLILFRNGREWVFTATIPFTVLYLQNLKEKQWTKLLQEFCNGVIFSFFIILGFSLLFRPYHRYNYSRYPLMFYSVATCSLYLIVVTVAALTNYLACIREKKSLKENAGSLLIFGTVSCYLFMTVSRTAMLAVGTAGIGVLILLGLTCYRDKLQSLLRQTVLLAAALIFIFPIAFTATRSIPALVGHPYIMGGEMWEETITAEDGMDSPKYMNMERFLELNFDKMLKYFAENTETGKAADDRYLFAYAGGFPSALLYAKDVTAETWYNESEGTFGNGRLDIYKAYLRNLNFTGHDDMLLEENNMIYYHAHNTFLQSAYDHGIFVGICFLLLGIASFGRSIYYFKEKEKSSIYAVLPFLIMTAFGAASLTEWTFHPSILLGFALLFVQAPLLGKVRKNEEKTL